MQRDEREPATAVGARSDVIRNGRRTNETTRIVTSRAAAQRLVAEDMREAAVARRMRGRRRMTTASG